MSVSTTDCLPNSVSDRVFPVSHLKLTGTSLVASTDNRHESQQAVAPAELVVKPIATPTTFRQCQGDPVIPPFSVAVRSRPTRPWPAAVSG